MRKTIFVCLVLFLAGYCFSAKVFECTFDSGLVCSGISPSTQTGALTLSGGSLFVGQDAQLGYDAPSVISKQQGTIKFRIKPSGWVKEDSSQRMIFRSIGATQGISLAYFAQVQEGYPDYQLSFAMGNWASPGEIVTLYADLEEFYVGQLFEEKYYEIVITWDNSSNEIAIYVDGELRGMSTHNFDFTSDALSPFYVLTSEVIAPEILPLNAYADYFEVWDSVEPPIEYSSCGGLGNHYQNPTHIDIADTSVFKHNGYYYVYGTKATNSDLGIPVWRSQDLRSWEYRGFAYNPQTDSNPWGTRLFWGGNMNYRGGLFYMTYSAEGPTVDGAKHKVAIAYSSSPEGPFINIAAPIIPQETSVDEIEGSMFIDDDGTPYLLYPRVESLSIVPFWAIRTYIIRLASDFRSAIGQPTLILDPDVSSWEYNINEGADIRKIDGVYYLMYSGQSADKKEYALGYATAQNPLGPWAKATENPIISRNMDKAVFGPGNGDFVKDLEDTGWLYFYHTKISHEVGWDRELNFDKLTIGGGAITADAPTRTPQKLNDACEYEICNNSKDDDLDGSIDCADDDCIGFIEWIIPNDYLCTQQQRVKCDSATSGKVYNTYSLGTSNNVNFDAVCRNKPSGDSWIECDTDGRRERINHGITYSEGDIMRSDGQDYDYLCTAAFSYESWVRCGSSSPPGPDGVGVALGEKISAGVTTYYCCAGNIWLNFSNLDVKEDGIIDVFDLVRLMKAYHEQDISFDVNGDGSVDLVDLQIIATNIGETV